MGSGCPVPPLVVRTFSASGGCITPGYSEEQDLMEDGTSFNARQGAPSFVMYYVARPQ